MSGLTVLGLTVLRLTVLGLTRLGLTRLGLTLRWLALRWLTISMLPVLRRAVSLLARLRLRLVGLRRLGHLGFSRLVGIRVGLSIWSTREIRTVSGVGVGWLVEWYLPTRVVWIAHDTTISPSVSSITSNAAGRYHYCLLASTAPFLCQCARYLCNKERLRFRIKSSQDHLVFLGGWVRHWWHQGVHVPA